MKYISYSLQAALLYLLYGFFSILSPAAASNIGGFLGRSVGPRLAASRKARANVALAFPGIPDIEKEKIVTEMWDNLGRVVAEYPHLEKIGRTRTTIVNADIARRVVEQGQGGVFFSGHNGNWEVNASAMLFQLDMAPHLTYRAANNPFTDYLLAKSRTLGGRIKAFPKARSSAKTLMNTMKEKKFIGILIDQKYNEGIAVDFFGVPAMTNPVAVALCQKYRSPLVPALNTRTGPAQFTLTLYEPLVLFSPDGTPLPQAEVLKNVHVMLESWIRKNPGQWLWLHRRWDSKQLNSN